MGPNQPASISSSRVCTHARSPWAAVAASSRSRWRPGRAWSQRNRASPDWKSTLAATSAARGVTSAPTCTWPWSAVTTTAVPAGTALEHVGDQPVGGGQLGVEVGAEAVLVADLVDTVVVGVHERLTGRGRARAISATIVDATRQPAEPDPVEVGAGEARSLELRPGDGRGALSAERGERLHLGREHLLAGVASLGGPTEDVQHLAVDGDAVADHAVLARWRAGADRRERGGGGGRQHRADRAALHRCQRRGQGMAPLQLVPAHAVEHEEHDAIGLDGSRW